MQGAYRVGADYFMAGKSLKDLLAFYNGDRNDREFRRAEMAYQHLEKEFARIREDTDEKKYTIDKLTDSLAELKRKADVVFGRIADAEEPGDCALEEPGKVP